MSENNDYNAPTEPTAIETVEVKPTYEALELMTQELSKSVERWTGLAKSYEQRADRLARENGDAANYILENVDEDWKDHAIAIMERLGQDTTTSKRYSVSITAIVTVEAELGKDIDLSDWDFDVDRLNISSNENGYEVQDVEDIEITEVSEY